MHAVEADMIRVKIESCLRPHAVFARAARNMEGRAECAADIGLSPFIYQYRIAERLRASGFTPPRTRGRNGKHFHSCEGIGKFRCTHYTRAYNASLVDRRESTSAAQRVNLIGQIEISEHRPTHSVVESASVGFPALSGGIDHAADDGENVNGDDLRCFEVIDGKSRQ